MIALKMEVEQYHVRLHAPGKSQGLSTHKRFYDQIPAGHNGPQIFSHRVVICDN
jgi:hypothetical protein